MAAVLALIDWRRPMASHGERRAYRLALAAMLLTTLLLIYGLTINPRPRMVLPLLAANAAAIGVLALRAWRGGERLIPIALALGLVVLGGTRMLISPRTDGAERAAAAWLAEGSAGVATDETTRRHLALVPAARGLPEDDGTAPMVLQLRFGTCAQTAPRDAETIRFHSFSEALPAVVRRLRGSQAAADSQAHTLCLFRRREAAAADVRPAP